MKGLVKLLASNHWAMMALCIGAISALWVLPSLGVRLGAAGILLLLAACAGSHVVMMRMMMGRHSPSGEADTHGHGSNPALVPEPGDVIEPLSSDSGRNLGSGSSAGTTSA